VLPVAISVFLIIGFFDSHARPLSVSAHLGG
jgi:hypothetical protein